MSDEPGDDNNAPRPHAKYLLRVAAALLAALVAAQIAIVLGRGVMCIYRGGCPVEEVIQGTEILGALIGTVIALIFALIK
jgi:hypothetical protein